MYCTCTCGLFEEMGRHSTRNVFFFVISFVTFFFGQGQFLDAWSTVEMLWYAQLL